VHTVQLIHNDVFATQTVTEELFSASKIMPLYTNQIHTAAGMPR